MYIERLFTYMQKFVYILYLYINMAQTVVQSTQRVLSSLIRILSTKRDSRYENLRKNPEAFRAIFKIYTSRHLITSHLTIKKFLTYVNL